MTQHKGIYAALAAAQAEMGKAVKDTENPHFKSKYADLASVMDACMPALNKNGIAVIQPFVTDEISGRAVKTILIHESGETLECTIPLIFGKNDMQGLGSAMTYGRRYGLMAMAGIAPEDDDGNAAAASVKGQPVNHQANGLTDAWRDAVLDSLPENASPRVKAEAFAKAICDGFAGKGEKALNNEWDRREKMIRKLESEYPDLFGQVVDAFETRRNELAEDRIAAE